MLLTVFSLLSYLALITSAAPGYVQEKRHGYSPYYPGRKNVSPRSVAINSRYSHAIRTRNSHGGGGGGGGGKHHYGGPQPILQTATTLINVHPTNGYRKCPPGGNQDDCGPPERSTGEPPITMPPIQTEPPHPTTTPCPSTTTTTTTELNIYQDNNKVVELRARLPAGQARPAYPTYQPPPPPVYQPPPPPPPPQYIPPPPPPPPPPRYDPPPPPRYAPPPPRYAAPPPSDTSEAPYHRPGETVIRIGPKDDEYGKKKYKVLICKLQQKD